MNLHTLHFVPPQSRSNILTTHYIVKHPKLHCRGCDTFCFAYPQKERCFEEKSLRHVAIVAKFQEDNKVKMSLKMLFPTILFFFDQFHLICKIMAKFSGIESLRTVFKFRKRKLKENFCVLFTNSIKRACEIRKFHVAVAQRELRNVQKSMTHVQSCCFANIHVNLLLFCPSSLPTLSS